MNWCNQDLIYNYTKHLSQPQTLLDYSRTSLQEIWSVKKWNIFCHSFNYGGTILTYRVYLIWLFVYMRKI